MKTIIFATGNRHKVSEVSRILKDKYEILSLKDLGFDGDIPETSDTFEGNALQKAHFVREKFGKDCFSEDTGLEIEVLDGEPGVYSGRYAGEPQVASNNMDKVLKKMKGEKNRKARFKTVIALIFNGKEHLFEGIVTGKILEARSGESGFGYDPIFQPDGFDITFAEMTSEEKNKISHRGRAVAKLVQFLKENDL